MYSSALVIGAGGTGRWVLTHLRARILGTPGWPAGQGPAPLGDVRLLGFDIDRQNSYEFAGHGLTESDLISSTPEIADVIRNIRDVPDGDSGARYHDVREWISQREAESYDLALLNEFMETGAGQLRQWGRLGVVRARGFYDRIRTVIGSLAAQGPVNVFVTGSLCGGTGSATIFDSAAIVHDVLRTVAQNMPSRIIGVFLLPAGMTHDVDPAEFRWLEACAFATMRELDRFQRGNGRNRLNHDGRKIVLDSRLFDLCYLLDGVRELRGGAVADLVNNKASLGVYPAMADLIFSYLNPASGQRLDSDATNTVTHIGGRHPYKYSKFGTYTLWSPLPLVQRSLAIDDAVAVLEALTSQVGRGEASSLVSTPVVTFEENDQQQRIFNAQVFLAARRYMEDHNDRPPRAAEVLDWLLPADPHRKPKIPPKPDYTNREFPNIKLLHTPYKNSDVKSRVDELLNKYLIDIQTLTDNHRRQLLTDFRSYLLIQCQRVASTPSMRGGLSRALNSLREIKDVADRLRESFADLNEREARRGRLDKLRGAYRNAQTAMDGNTRWSDVMKQRQLFEAATRLLEAELDAQVRAKLIDLMEQLSSIVDDVRGSEIDGWQRTLDDVADQARLASADLDRIWSDHSSVVVRQLVLARRSGLETAARRHLIDNFLGEMPAGRKTTITSPAAAFVEQRLRWAVGRGSITDPFTLRLSGPWKEDGQELKLHDLLSALESSYEFVLNTPFGESLKHSSKNIVDLASDINQKVNLLSSSAPEAGTKPAPLPTQQVLLFGPWGDKTPEVRRLREELGRQGFTGGQFEDVLQLTAADATAAAGVPLNQSVWAVRNYHGVSVGGFGTIDRLRKCYLALRDGEKPLHVFPEESAVSSMEKRIEELSQAGLLSSRIDLLGSEAVGIARESLLIRQVVLLIAAKQLEWCFDRLDGKGKWILAADGREPLVIATADKASNIFAILVDHAERLPDPSSRRIVDAIHKEAQNFRDFDDDSEVANKLKGIADGSIDEPGISGLDEDVRVIVRVSSLTLLGF